MALLPVGLLFPQGRLDRFEAAPSRLTSSECNFFSSERKSPQLKERCSENMFNNSKRLGLSAGYLIHILALIGLLLSYLHSLPWLNLRIALHRQHLSHVNGQHHQSRMIFQNVPLGNDVIIINFTPQVLDRVQPNES
jgi:hypothetical protein